MPTSGSDQDTSTASAGEKHKLDDRDSPAPKSAKTKDRSNPTKAEEQSDDKPPPATLAASATTPATSATTPITQGDSSHQPSKVLEKGIIYFFTRSGLDVDEPKSLVNIARSYMILRPIPADTDLASPAAVDAAAPACRLVAISGTLFPRCGGVIWMASVEKAAALVADLKETFLAGTGSECETTTAGTRHIPPPTLAGEGVYSLTGIGPVSNLCYILTIPKELGEAQKTMGIKERGSFIVRTRNPTFPAPPSARIAGEDVEYPKEVLDEFVSNRWIMTLPKHLDYAKTTILLMGERSDIEKAMELSEEGPKEEGKQEPIHETDGMAQEDMEVLEHLGQHDSTAIFADLEARANDYPKLKTTF